MKKKIAIPAESGKLCAHFGHCEKFYIADVENGEITDRFSTFVNPKVPIPFRIEQLTSINDSMVMDAPTIEEVLPKFLEFSKDAVMVAHNADFDMGFIMKNCDRLGIAHDFTYVDTVGMARFLLPALNRFKLDTVAKAVADAAIKDGVARV